MATILLLGAALAAAPPFLGPDGVGWFGPLPPGLATSVTVDADTARLLVDEEDESGVLRWDGQRWVRGGVPLTAANPVAGQTFNTDGQLTRAVDSRGVQRLYGYTTEGRLARVAWPDGREVLVSYDRQGRVAEIRGPGARVERYRWGDSLRVQRVPGGRLERQAINPGAGADRAFAVRNGAGREVRSFYAEGKLVAWEDPRGLRTVLDRDEGRVRLQLPTGSSWVARFDPEGRLEQLTGPRGGEWRWTWGPHGALSRRDPTGRMVRSSFDEAGRLVSRSFGGRRYSIVRDDSGQFRGLRSPTGAETLVERDGQGQVAAVVDAAGSRIELTRKNGVITSVTRRDGGVWSLERDRERRIEKLESPEGWSLAIRRDSRGQVVELNDSAFGRTRVFRDAEGRVTQVTAPDGRKTGLVRDAHGAVTSVRRPDGSTVRIERDASGEIRWVSLGQKGVDIERDPRGLPTRAGPVRWARDLRGGVVKLSTPALELSLERDLEGRLWGATSGPWSLGIQHDASGFPIAWRGSDGDHVIQRDANGLVVTESDGSAEARGLRGPRGHLQRITLGEHQWRLSRDAAGRVLRVAGPGSLKGGLDRDDAGRTTLIRYPSGVLKKRSFEGNLVHTRVEAPSGSPLLQRTTLWGPGKQIGWVQEGDEDRRVWRYDPLGALVAIEGGGDAWSWGVDSTQGPFEQASVFNSTGKLQEARIAPGIPAWGVATRALSAYQDEAGRVSGYSGELGAAELRYDAVGRLETLSAAGQTWRVEWDALGRLASVTDPTGASRTFSWVPGSSGASRDLLKVGEDQLWLPGFDEPVAVKTPGGVESIVSINGDPRFVADGAGQVLAIATTPAGRADSGASRSAGAEGGVPLFAGGPLFFGSVAVDPVSGMQVGEVVAWPWAVPARRGPFGRTHLDPTAWSPTGPWHQPLVLLSGLGELTLPGGEAGVEVLSPPPAVAWLPSGLDHDQMAFGDQPWVVPVGEEPMVVSLLSAVLPGASAPGAGWLVEAAVGEMASLWDDLPPDLRIPGLERLDPSLSRSQQGWEGN